MSRTAITVVVAVVLATACSSTPDASDPDADASPDTTAEANTAEVDEASDVDTSADAADQTQEATESGQTTTTPDNADPARPSPTGNGEPDDNPAWLGRDEMSETAIVLPWSTGKVPATVAIHRFLAEDVADAADEVLTDNSRVSSGEESPFVDTDLAPGQRYLYVMEAITDAGVSYRRFTEAHAVNDTSPPEPVTDLAAVDTGDAISLEWGRSSDNYQFARYAIRRSVDGEQSVYYGTGWTIDQTAFVDDQPPTSGSVTYEVYAVDFHGNVSEARTITTAR